MPHPAPSLEPHLARLSAALDGLDAAILRRRARDESKGNRDAELSLMQEDRARLADELDATLARLNRLDAAAADTSQRITRAMQAVRAVMDDGPDGG